MSSIGQEERKIFKTVVCSDLDKSSTQTIKSTLGIHIFKCMRLLSDKDVLDKFSKIIKAKDGETDVGELQKEKEFYYSKIINLKRKLEENMCNLKMKEEMKHRSMSI